MFCSSCGSGVSSTHRFCASCGAAVLVRQLDEVVPNTNPDDVSEIDDLVDTRLLTEISGNWYRTSELRSLAWKEVGTGLLWLAGGGLASYVGYSHSGDGGGYMLFYGALLYGAYRVLRGFYFFVNPSAMFKAD